MRQALGRGLEALLKPAPGGDDRSTVTKIPLDKIRPNRHQPRVRFAQDALEDLANSIRNHGLAQPLLVSPAAVPGEFELVAGERRLRAAKMAGLAQVPCVVRTVSERERHELSLVENIQRENLNVIEEAESMRKLMDTASLTQEDMAKVLGKSRSAVANKLRLLELSQMIRNALMEGLLTEGHARSLLAVPDLAEREELAKRIVQEKLSVRDVERWVQVQSVPKRKPRSAGRKDPDLRHLEEELQRHLSRRVELKPRGKNRGWIRLEFYSIDDLQALVTELRRVHTSNARQS